MDRVLPREYLRWHPVQRSGTALTGANCEDARLKKSSEKPHATQRRLPQLALDPGGQSLGRSATLRTVVIARENHAAAADLRAA